MKGKYFETDNQTGNMMDHEFNMFLGIGKAIIDRLDRIAYALEEINLNKYDDKGNIIDLL